MRKRLRLPEVVRRWRRVVNSAGFCMCWKGLVCSKGIIWLMMKGFGQCCEDFGVEEIVLVLGLVLHSVLCKKWCGNNDLERVGIVGF